jgi:hypothetical protein
MTVRLVDTVEDVLGAALEQPEVSSGAAGAAS